MSEYVTAEAKNIRYFNSIRGYTLALLNAFNNVKLYVNQPDDEKDKIFTVPISFGNYEKSISLSDISENDLLQTNINILPRLVLSFEGMTKAPERQTNKFQKLSRRIYHPEYKKDMIQVSYNSLSYDFHYSLLVQTRGLTQASQLTEQILSYFRPTMNLNILECPIFEEKTETQIQISDPAFEINQEFEETDINVISVTFDLTVRGNIYSPIEMVGVLESIKLFTHIWDEADYHDSKLSSYYKFVPEEHKAIERVFDGTTPYSPAVEGSLEALEKERPDFHPEEEIIKTK